MGVSKGRYHSFLVRVWARKGHFVHGEVTDAATQESVRFREFPRLLHFIRAGVRRPNDETPEDELAMAAGADGPVALPLPPARQPNRNGH